MKITDTNKPDSVIALLKNKSQKGTYSRLLKIALYRKYRPAKKANFSFWKRAGMTTVDLGTLNSLIWCRMR